MAIHELPSDNLVLFNAGFGVIFVLVGGSEGKHYSRLINWPINLRLFAWVLIFTPFGYSKTTRPGGLEGSRGLLSILIKLFCGFDWPINLRSQYLYLEKLTLFSRQKPFLVLPSVLKNFS